MQDQALSSNSKVQPIRRSSGITIWSWWLALFLISAVPFFCGCSTAQHAGLAANRQFNFERDTFAFPNQLVWDYSFDASGNWVSRPHEPKPDYTHHCFVVTRSSKQFFQNATFDPKHTPTDDETYRELVRRVVSLSLRHEVPESERIVIPGYADLRSFSAAHEDILKAECGGAWQSYAQRGHWRMILPFSRSQQEKMASHLSADLKENKPPVVHVVRFPQLSINHSIMLFGVRETETAILFDAYDPNKPLAPVTLSYDRKSRTFNFPGNDYWPGGRVDIYEIYCSWAY